MHPAAAVFIGRGFPPVFQQEQGVPAVGSQGLVHGRIGAGIGVLSDEGSLLRVAFLYPLPGADGEFEHCPSLLHIVAQGVKEDAPIIYTADVGAAQAVVQGGVIAHLLNAVAPHQKIVDQLPVFQWIAGYIVVPGNDPGPHGCRPRFPG